MSLIFALLRTLTWAKLRALLQAQLAFVLARFFHRVSAPYFPPYVTIEPTNRCQLSCPECIAGSGQLERPIGDMSLEAFKRIIDAIAKHTLVLNLYMQGEPYLHPQLSEMITYAKAKGLFVSISTNANVAMNLDLASLPQHLVISVDGATQASYEKYRHGGQLQKVQDFVEAIAHLKHQKRASLPYVELQCVVNRYNEQEMGAIKQLFRGQYNRFVRKSMQIIHDENREEFVPQATCCNRYVNSKAIQPGCYKMLSSLVITQDGVMVPCCMDKNAQFAYGHVADTSLMSLLESDVVTQFKRRLIDQKNQISICRNCPFA